MEDTASTDIVTGEDMKILQALLMLCITLFATDVFAEQPKENIIAVSPRTVSLVRLIAVPEKYDKCMVRVEGFLHMEFEGTALYLHREDYERLLLQNGVSVDIPRNKGFDEYDNQYVRIEGVFKRCDDSQYECQFSGAILHVGHVKTIQPR